MVLTTAINGDRAFALPVALRRRPEARLLPPPPARSIQAARNGSPALRLGKTPAVLRLEGRLVPLRLADATVPSLRADPTLKPNGAVAVPINAKARALSRARASARPMCRNCVATVAPSPASRAGSGAPALPFRRARIALCSIVACLLFLFLGSCISHGSAGLEPTAEDKLLKAPVAPGYSFAFSTPRSQWQAGTMPHIYQIDPAWSELPYAGGTIRQNACGPTCLTMVYIFKTGRTDMTPVDMCALSEAGNYAPTGATEWSFMTSGAWQLGLNGTELHNDCDSMTQALRSGAPVIAAVRPGTFTNVGHYIVLYGIDDADQIEVFDPNSASRSARRWGVVEVLNEVEAMWAYY